MFDAANRSNTAIYAWIRAAWRPASSTSTKTSRCSAATSRCGRRRTRCGCSPTKTDGRAIVNRNDLGRAMEADRSRLERLLPDRLQLDAGAAGRQVPRDQGAREAPGRPGARAQGLLGPDATTAKRAAPAAGRDRRRRCRKRRRRSRRPTAASSAPGSATTRARTARRRSRSCGSRCRRRRAMKRESRVGLVTRRHPTAKYFRGHRLSRPRRAGRVRPRATKGRRCASMWPPEVSWCG